MASALSAPQGGKQEIQQQVLQSQAPLQLILLPGGAGQSTYTTSSVQGQQTAPAGGQPSQILYLQPAGFQNGVGQSQVAYIQGASQGQESYIQGGAPQIAYILGGAPQNQLSYIQGASQSQFGVSQGVAPAPQLQSQGTFSTVQTVNSQKSVSSQTYQPAPPSSLANYKKTQTKPESYKPAPSTSYKPAPAPVAAKSKPNYKGSPSPGSPGTPGQGGLVGYVTIKQSQDDNFDGNFQYE